MEFVHKAVRLVVFPLLFFLFFSTNVAGFDAKSEFSEIEEKIKVTTNQYMKLEESFEKVRRYIDESLPRTGLNVSLRKQGDLQHTIRAIELFVDGKPILGHIYTEYEAQGIEMGGRQLLYDEDITQGVHLVAAKAYLLQKGSENRVILEKTGVKVQAFDDMTVLLEILLEEKEGKPGLHFNYVKDSEEMKNIGE